MKQNLDDLEKIVSSKTNNKEATLTHLRNYEKDIQKQSLSSYFKGIQNHQHLMNGIVNIQNGKSVSQGRR